MNTDQFVSKLCSLPTNGDKHIFSEEVDFDVSRFCALISQTRFKIVSSSEGAVSYVKQGVDLRDFSRLTGTFDFHCDGLYRENLPNFVLLYCLDEGTGQTSTVLSDSAKALQSLEGNSSLEILNNLETVYISKDGTQYAHDLIQNHPMTKEKVLIVGSRAYLRPRYTGSSIAGLPTCREIAKAGAAVYTALETATEYEQFWHRGHLLLFDNYRFMHRRVSRGADAKRELIRIWLSIQ